MSYLKWVAIAFYTIGVALLILGKNQLMDWIQADSGAQLPIVLVCVVLLAAIPFIPFGIVGAIVGAKYGFIWGGTINLAASTLAALITYALFRHVFQARGMIWLQRSKRLQHVDQAIRNNLFWTLTIARMIPIMPAFLVNTYSGVFGLPIRTFLLTTAIGKIPAMLVFALVGEHVAAGSRNWIGVVSIYLIFLLIVYMLYRVLAHRNMA